MINFFAIYNTEFIIDDTLYEIYIYYALYIYLLSIIYTLYITYELLIFRNVILCAYQATAACNNLSPDFTPTSLHTLQ